MCQAVQAFYRGTYLVARQPSVRTLLSALMCPSIILVTNANLRANPEGSISLMIVSMRGKKWKRGVILVGSDETRD
jgi:hypothetical protein